MRDWDIAGLKVGSYCDASVLNGLPKLQDMKTLEGRTVRRFNGSDIVAEGTDASGFFSASCAILAIFDMNKNQLRDVLSDTCLFNTKSAKSLLYVKIGDKKTIPMMSGPDTAKLVRRLKKRERRQATDPKPKSVVAPEAPDAAMPVGRVVSIAVKIAAVLVVTPVPVVTNVAAVGQGGFDEGTTSPMRMPPPNFRAAPFNDALIISKQLCDIKHLGFKLKSRLSVRFRQRDEKVFMPDLLVQTGRFKTTLEANNAILEMVENGTITDLDSFEVDDEFRSVASRCLILMSLPHAVELLHRLGVCTVEDDVIVAEFEMAVASGAAKDVVMSQVEVAAVSVIMPEIEMVTASDAAQAITMPEIMTPSAAAKVRMRKVSASVLKTLPGLANLDDSCFAGLELRQVEEGEVDEDGNDIGGFFVLVDVAAVLLYKEASNARAFVRNPKNINKDTLKSLTYVDSGNPNVSNI